MQTFCSWIFIWEGASGIDAANILRGKGYNGTLIFTTTSREHYAEGFDLAAAHYLIKPITWGILL